MRRPRPGDGRRARGKPPRRGPSRRAHPAPRPVAPSHEPKRRAVPVRPLAGLALLIVLLLALAILVP